MAQFKPVNDRTAVGLTGRSFLAADQATDRLVEAEVLVQVDVGRRNRTFEAPELLDLFTALERRPARPVRRADR